MKVPGPGEPAPAAASPEQTSPCRAPEGAGQGWGTAAGGSRRGQTVSLLQPGAETREIAGAKPTVTAHMRSLGDEKEPAGICQKPIISNQSHFF